MTVAIRIFASIAALAALAVPAAAQGDVAGASDHPLVGRYEGAVITSYERKEYEELSLPVAAPTRETGDDAPAWQKELAGTLTSIRYEGPGGRSALEVARNHRLALEEGGFEVVFACRGEDCGKGMESTFWDVGRGPVGLPTNWHTTNYLFAEREDGNGLVSVAILAVETAARGDVPLTAHVAVNVVEGEVMDTGMVSLVEAGELEKAIAQDGRIAVYGIYFDFDEAELKPESGPQIAELATLMTENPELQVLVVGHTDGQGAFDYNLSLSQRRAKAVVDALVAQHGIAPARLTPAGAGMVAPVATNRTEEGRAKNRRVEIVERWTGS